MNTPFPHFFRLANIQHGPLLQDDELRKALQTMWDYEGSGPYHEQDSNEPEWGEDWEWEDVKLEGEDEYGDGVEEPMDPMDPMEPEPHDPWDDGSPDTMRQFKSQTCPAPPPPPPPPETAQGHQEQWGKPQKQWGKPQEQWGKWNTWKGWGETWGTTPWKSKPGTSWNSKWKNSKAPWASQKKAKTDGCYPKGGGFTDSNGEWWPFLDSG